MVLSTVHNDVNCLKAMLSKALRWGFLKDHARKCVSPLKNHQAGCAI